MAGTVIEKIKTENKHLQHKPSTGFHFSFLSPVAFDNDDMESSKRRVTFLSLIFLSKRKYCPRKEVKLIVDQ